MDDYYGNELVSGWYWYSTEAEPNKFQPVLIDIDREIITIGERKLALDYLTGFNLFNAEMPACPICDGTGMVDGPGDGHPSAKTVCIECK